MKFVVTLFILSFLAACSSGSGSGSSPTSSTLPTSDVSNEKLFERLDASLADIQVVSSDNLTGLWVYYSKGIANTRFESDALTSVSEDTLYLAAAIVSVQQRDNGGIEIAHFSCSREKPIDSNFLGEGFYVGKVRDGVMRVDGNNRHVSRLLPKLLYSFSLDDRSQPLPLAGNIIDNVIMEFDPISYEDNSGLVKGTVSATLKARKILNSYIGKIGDIAIDGEAPFPAECYRYQLVRNNDTNTTADGVFLSDFVQSILSISGSRPTNSGRSSQLFTYGDVKMNNVPTGQGLGGQTIIFTAMDSVGRVVLNTGSGDTVKVIEQGTRALPAQLDVSGQNKTGTKSLSGSINIDVLP